MESNAYASGTRRPGLLYDLRVLVCGGRQYGRPLDVYPSAESRQLDLQERVAPERALLFDYLSYVHERRTIAAIIQGGARGADALAKEWAQQHGCDSVEFPADWERYGKRAGFLRNAQMLREGDPHVVFAFPGGRGTAHMIQLARNFPIQVVEPHLEPDIWRRTLHPTD